MKLGVLTVPLQNESTETTFKYLSSLGVQTVELGAGGYTNSNHLNPEVLIENPSKIDELKELLKKYNLEISALSCHGNPVHPNKEIAKRDHSIFERTVVLAQKLGVDTIVTFSGCPGDCKNSEYPNWVTCSWPDDFGRILDYQWNEVLIPYWEKAVKIANDGGIKKIGLELHPGFCCYNTSSLLKLRKAVGDTIGANFDPSHLFWQGIDPVAAIRELKGAIYHFHAKDTKIDYINCNVNGVLDTGFYGDPSTRSWIFRTVGYGHGEEVWKNIISALKIAGYDGAISIEHEDCFMSTKEGLEKAIAFLKNVIIYENPSQIWWT